MYPLSGTTLMPIINNRLNIGGLISVSEMVISSNFVERTCANNSRAT